MESPQNPPTNNLVSLEKRQEMLLVSWIEWYEKVMIWQKKAKDSLSKVKNLYEKEVLSQKKSEKAKDDYIKALEMENLALKERLKTAPIWGVISGIGGFGLGIVIDRLIK